MAIKTFKPYTPARRNMTVSGFDGVDKKAKPERSLVETLKKHSGRNSYGRITVRHRGGGNRKKYRIRIYNFSDRVIKLECKSKYGDLISKQSVSIPRELADQLIAGDPEGLQRMRHPLLHDVYREMKTRLLRPVVIVDYIREAYIHPAEEVRITFDKQIRTGLYQTAMFDASIPTYPVFDDPVEVLEVKYDEFLPTYMQAILSGVTAQRSAVSKYTWCRRYENKEF